MIADSGGSRPAAASSPAWPPRPTRRLRAPPPSPAVPVALVAVLILGSLAAYNAVYQHVHQQTELLHQEVLNRVVQQADGSTRSASLHSAQGAGAKAVVSDWGQGRLSAHVRDCKAQDALKAPSRQRC